MEIEEVSENEPKEVDLERVLARLKVLEKQTGEAAEQFSQQVQTFQEREKELLGNGGLTKKLLVSGCKISESGKALLLGGKNTWNFSLRKVFLIFWEDVLERIKNNLKKAGF